MDVADSDFLSNKEFDDEDSEFETDLERYFVFSTAKNRFFGRKIPLRVILGSGLTSVILLIVPVVYEKHGDIIDILAERVLFELNNLYENLMMKIFGKSQNSQEYIED
ncbi:hypothetical protein LR48_Vigan09g140900 [Vigna angularis]|uniref:Reticulon domain-containing protein n=1 Tax=Phaseolus angularis TaxID=3914 RepID=A0A0L9VCF4_PHAAN|nr:hypothetical protein LR48_Vigan09g140900 [Vigna angularis]